MAAQNSQPESSDLSRYSWTYAVTIGDLHPSTIPSRAEADRQLADQTALLNRCLQTGRIIAKSQSAAIFSVGERGEHQLHTGAVTFIVGFPRRPYWLPESAATEPPP